MGPVKSNLNLNVDIPQTEVLSSDSAMSTSCRSTEWIHSLVSVLISERPRFVAGAEEDNVEKRPAVSRVKFVEVGNDHPRSVSDLLLGTLVQPSA